MKRPTRIAGNTEFLTQVATVYRDAMAAGLNPTAQLALVAEVDQRTAERWVAHARAIGVLGPARKGTAGEYAAEQSG